MVEKKKLDKNRILDHVIKLERKRKIKKFSLLAAVVLVFGALYSYSVVKNYDRVKFSKEVNGLVESIEETSSGNKSLSVRLPSEETVSLTISNAKNEIVENQSIKILQEELANGQMRYSLVSE